MATYKLIQDIEAEDKILGPLTLRQFIFAILSVFFFYICFVCFTKLSPFFLIFFLPPALFFGFFALPLGRDQPTELWALAKIRYFLKPRIRIWNQSGVKELVTITAPKKVERILTKGFGADEATSRLQALANTIDSRGWAVKHVDLNAFSPPMYVPPASDRLLDPATLPQVVPQSDIGAADDMLDPRNNPVARQFQNLIDQTAQGKRDDIVSRMNDSTGAQPPMATPTNNYWFMDNTSTASPTSTSDSSGKRPDNNTSSQHKTYSNLRSAKPASKNDNKPAPLPPPAPVTAPTDPAILALAENDDLNVATLAREAKRSKDKDDNSQDEVVVSLH